MLLASNGFQDIFWNKGTFFHKMFQVLQWRISFININYLGILESHVNFITNAIEPLWSLASVFDYIIFVLSE